MVDGPLQQESDDWIAERLKEIESIAEDSEKVEALIDLAVAPNLSETEQRAVLERALTAANNIQHDRYKAQALIAIAPRLPETDKELLEQAIAIADTITDDAYRARALSAIAPRLPESEQRAVLERALTITDNIPHDLYKTEALIAIAPRLPETATDLLSKALTTAIALTNDEYKALALSAIAPRLPETDKELLEQAIAIADTITDDAYRARALSAIAPRLPAPEQRVVLERALTAAENIQDDDYKAEALSVIAPHLPASDRALLERTLTAADTIQGKYSKALVLSAIAPRLPASEQRAVLERALKAVDNIQDDRFKADVLSKIAPSLPKSDRELLGRALSFAAYIKDDKSKADALSAIAPRLSETETDLLERAFAAAQSISDDKFRANVLVRLAPNLPEPIHDEAKASVPEEVWQAATEDFQKEQASATQSEQAQPVPSIANLIAQSFKNDAAAGVDLLGIEPEVYALAEVLGMRALTPPLAVGILGGWGSGKSFVMHLMRQRLNAINQDSVTEEQAWGLKAGSPVGEASPYVGHVYQIYFNSWTYAKADLWSSLMQTIFHEFNCQLTIEKHLRDTFAIHNAVTSLMSRLTKTSSKTAKPDKILNFIKDLQDTRPETDAFLQILMPQFWEKIEELSKDEESSDSKSPFSESINWAILESDLKQYFDKGTAERWQNLSHKDLKEIWDKAQQYAIDKILAGGVIWDVISTELTADERDEMIKNESSLGELGLLIWQELIANSRTQGVIWSELSNLRRRDQKELQVVEKNLIYAEKALENKEKIAKLSARKKFEQQKTAILWNPVLSQAYNLLGIDPNQVNKWKAVLKSWRQPLRAYIALGCLAILLIVGNLPDWSDQVAALKVISEQVWLFLIEFFEKYWFISLPSSLYLLQKIWGIAQHYFDQVKKAQANLESQYQEWLVEAREEAKILESSQKIEGLRLQAEQKRLQVGLVADQSSLLSFVTNRLQEDSYDRRLGLIHQISRDLNNLSHRLVYKNQDPTSERAQHIRDLFPRGPARVVLYIDDLDRCPPDRVVNVLEAVQLLLNTPLFVVVLAIDDRYIARALETAYQGVLKRGGSPSGIDYLEKIIQIPYRTRPIAGDAIGAYLKNHIDIEQEKQTVAEPVNHGQDVRDPVEGSDSQRLKDVSTNLEQKLPVEVVKPPPPQVAKFTAAEFETLKAYCQEVDLSPRTAKRLINIYKILKIMWFRSKRDQQQNAETIKKAVLAILVLSGRYPTFMREVLAEISRFYEERDDEKSDQADQKLLMDCFEEPFDHLKHVRDPYLMRERKKFSHDVKQIIEPLGLTLRDIGAPNFNLALSFCFVGDIGYDPADYQVEESKARENGKYRDAAETAPDPENLLSM